MIASPYRLWDGTSKSKGLDWNTVNDNRLDCPLCRQGLGNGSGVRGEPTLIVQGGVSLQENPSTYLSVFYKITPFFFDLLSQIWNLRSLTEVSVILLRQNSSNNVKLSNKL